MINRIFLIISFVGLLSYSGYTQFQFEYTGPDTLFVNNNCEAILDWGHPNTPTVTSTIGANIDSFYIYSISDDYQMNEVVEAGVKVTVTYRATDDQDNADFFSFDIDFVDTLEPLITVLPTDESYICSTAEDIIIQNLHNWYNNHAGMIAVDNCNDVTYWADKTLQETETEFNQSVNENCGNTRSVTVFFTAIDQYDNASTDTLDAMFFTFDNAKPVGVSNPDPLDIVCDEKADSLLEDWLDNKGGAEVVDNCTATENIIWHFIWQDNYGNSGIDLVGDKPYSLKAKKYCEYEVSINFIAEDECGNKYATSFHTTFNSHDESVPVFNFLPQDTTIDCSAEIPYPNIAAYDDCKGNLEVLFSEVSSRGENKDSCDYYNYSIVQSWEADDGCGNLIQHSRTITVIDNTKPDFEVPDDITVGCSDTENLEITGEPKNVSDNCYQNLNIRYQDQKEGSGCQYDIFRTWTLEDACGNITSKVQKIMVVDTVFPEILQEPTNITLSCDDVVLFEEAFDQWIADRGNASVTDNCNKVYSFAAKPGSYTPGQVSTFPGEAVYFDMTDTLQCDKDTVLYYKDVDFVFYDRCFNTLSFTRRFAVVDVISPQISVCPEDTLIILPQNVCETPVVLTMPDAIDNCAGKEIEITKNLRKEIESDTAGSYTAPVNTVVLDIGPFNPDEFNPSELTELKLSFTNLDADDVNEYFLILGENGEIIDTTDHTENQCEDIEMDIGDKIPLDQFKSWITDGYLTLTLQPNIPQGIGKLAINDICGGTYVTVDLVFKRENPNRLQNSIIIDDGEKIDLGIGNTFLTNLTSGIHDIQYIISDCGNNSSSCINTIEIQDKQAPDLTCPPGFTVDLQQDSCVAKVSLPMDFIYDDNCTGTFNRNITVPVDPEDALLHFSFNSDLNDYTVNSKVFNFENLSNQHLLIKPKLKIKINGDVDETDEYFEILSEDGEIIGNTSNANNNTIAGNCSTPAFTVISLDSAKFNKWLGDGMVIFTARPVSGTNSINPCDTTVENDGQSDGISKMFMTLDYDEIDLSFYVLGNTEIEKTDFGNNLVPPQILLKGGQSDVFYVLDDGSGNKDTCSFTVNVKDTQPPKAICNDYYVLFVNANGLDSTVIDPIEIGSRSYDNCEIDTMMVVPGTFDCSYSGTNQDIVLYVKDKAGLVDSCTMNIKIEVEVLHPEFSSGVCKNDSLKLFANLPDAPPNTWTINWTGPQNFMSNLENPIRPNADASYSGTYTLTVTGLNGCQTSGSVEVAIEDLSQPQLIFAKDKVCEGGEVLMETNSYSSEVKYYWYEGFYPSGDIIDSTYVPHLMIMPDIGDHYYYVLVKSKNCISLASVSGLVQVLKQPEAIIQNNFVSLCEGESFSLETQSNGQGYSYHWWGPNGFDSNLTNPPSIDNITPLDQGTYYLAVTNDICSDTAKMELVVFDKPVTPIIENDSVFCQGETIVLTVNNITTGDNYLWLLNNNLYITQNSNSLIIQDAQTEYQGAWSVIVQSGNCYSDTSGLSFVEVKEAYDIDAANDGPVCYGDEFTLFAPPILDAKYHWTGPDGFESYEQNPVVSGYKSGEYQLTVTSLYGCIYYSATYVEVKDRPQITAISNNAPDCVNGHDCVRFYPSVFPNNVDFDFQWFGPDGFTSHDSIPEICNFDTSGNGVYYLVISDGFCHSDTLISEIYSNKIPETPVLEGDNTICQGDSLKLNIKNANYGEGAIFHWIITPGSGEYKTKKSYFVIPKVELSNTGTFSVYVENEGCTSDYSGEIDVLVIPKPNQPFITGTEKVCEGEYIKLNTPYVDGAVYEWSGPGFNSNSQNPEIFPATLSNSGIYTVKVTVDGCESIQSEGFRVEVVPKPDVPEIEAIDSGYCVTGGNVSVTLCLKDLKAATTYSWYLNGTPAVFLAETDTKCMEITDFTNFIDGENFVFVIAQKDGCESDYSDIASIKISKSPGRIANAGEDQFVCDPEQVLVQAFPDPEGQWDVLTEGVYLDNPDKAKTRVFDLQEGNNYFVWSLSHGYCPDYSSDTTVIYLEYQPEATDDSYYTSYNTELTFYPDENDINTENTDIEIFDTLDIHGQIIKKDDGSFTYIPSPSFIGTVELKYKLYKIECEDKNDEASIFIKVGKDSNCFGVNVITPNGDGVNDFLIFPCLESGAYPHNELIIFNQWGNQVYRDYNYENNWAGTYNGKDLPVGTYYYVLFLDENKDNVEKGFFVIER